MPSRVKLGLSTDSIARGSVCDPGRSHTQRSHTVHTHTQCTARRLSLGTPASPVAAAPRLPLYSQIKILRPVGSARKFLGTWPRGFARRDRSGTESPEGRGDPPMRAHPCADRIATKGPELQYDFKDLWTADPPEHARESGAIRCVTDALIRAMLLL